MNQKIKTFYDARMSCPSGSFSPSGEKPAKVVTDWLANDWIEVVDFSPSTNEDLELAHSPDYIRRIFAGEVANGHHNYNLAVAESTRWTVGSMVAAALAAVESSLITCSPSSGFHHANYDYSQGYCTFNGLIVAARRAIDLPSVRQVAILDCDWHAGDGTQYIIERFGLHEQIVHHSSGMEWRPTASDYFDWLEQALKDIVDRQVDLVLYQAGADAHKNDPLGGLLDNDELAQRDELCFEIYRKHQIPIAWNLAGGYQKEKDGSIEKVLVIHRATMQLAVSAVTQNA